MINFISKLNPKKSYFPLPFPHPASTASYLGGKQLKFETSQLAQHLLKLHMTIFNVLRS